VALATALGTARNRKHLMETSYEDRFWESADGLKLHFRDYPGRSDRPPLLCLHGLTRNARDFEQLAQRYAGEWRVIVPEMRGRGESDYAKDTSTYLPPVYVGDVFKLLADEGIHRFVSVATSMGGLMTMMMASVKPEMIAGALLNDIGPVLQTDGLDHIRSYLGQQRSFPTWMHAARALQEVQQESHPDFTVDDWLVMAKRTMCLGQNGRISFDYDMGIAEPFNNTGVIDDESKTGGEAPDLWPAFMALSGRPLLLVRGGLSTLLAEEAALEMQRRIPEMELVTVPRSGHAPTLDEPEVLEALDRMLAKVA